MDMEAEQWHRKAADLNDADAMVKLAVRLRDHGEKAEAEHWYRKAAELNHARAMFNLGVLLEVRGEKAEAEHWYRKAAELNYPKPMFDVGPRLENHRKKAKAEPDERSRADEYWYDSTALRTTAAVALLVGAVLGTGVLFAMNVLGSDRDGSAAPSAALSAPAAPPAASAPLKTQTSPAATCRDNVAQFISSVWTKVDPDRDELRGFDDAALVRLGHAALRRPSVLETTELVPFQRKRFIGAANEWLCH